MKIADVIKRTDKILPNYNFDEEQKINWLAEFDERLLREVYATHEILCDIETTEWIQYIREKFKPLYEALGEDIPEIEEVVINTETELLIPGQYSEIYVYYLCYKYCLFGGEADRANMFASEYYTMYTNYLNWLNRKFRPLQNNKITGG